MNGEFVYLDSIYSTLESFMINNMGFIALFTAGVLAVACGASVKTYKSQIAERHIYRRKLKSRKWAGILERPTSVFPFSLIRQNIKDSLSLRFFNEFELNIAVNIVLMFLAGAIIILIFLMKDIGQLWYVRLLITAMCVILPYYITALLLDLYKFRVNRQIPVMIDEFRSAFIRHNKVKPALKECSLHIDKNLGRIISSASDSTFIEASLESLRSRFNNTWFNIFVVLLINYKENGGALIDQLYKLNKTMTRYGVIEKKKNKRLIWYEMFAVMASILSIPAIMWLNSNLLGYETGAVIDAQSNMIISRIIGFSIVSLIIIRILRKM